MSDLNVFLKHSAKETMLSFTKIQKWDCTKFTASKAGGWQWHKQRLVLWILMVKMHLVQGYGREWGTVGSFQLHQNTTKQRCDRCWAAQSEAVPVPHETAMLKWPLIYPVGLGQLQKSPKGNVHLPHDKPWSWQYFSLNLQGALCLASRRKHGIH